MPDLKSLIEQLWSRLNRDPRDASPRKAINDWLVIHWGAAAATVLSGGVGGARPEVRWLQSVPWPEGIDPFDAPDAAGRALQLALSQAGVAQMPTVVLLPREALVVRRLDVPDAPDAELPDLVRFQAAARASTPIERLALDFLPLQAAAEGGPRPVLVMTTDESRVRGLAKAVQLAGLSLAGVSPAPLATAELALRAIAAEQHDGPTLLLELAPDGAELSLLDGRMLVFSHAMRLPRDDAAARLSLLQVEINRSLVAWSQAHPDRVVADACLAPAAGAPQDVRDLLERRFPGKVRLLDPRTFVDSRRPPPEGDALLAVQPALVGGLLARRDPLAPTIDLLNPRRRPVVRDNRVRNLRLAGIAALAIGAFGLWSYQSALGDRDAQIDELQETKAQLAGELQRAKSELDADADLTRWTLSDTRPLAGLSQLADLNPDTAKLYFTQGTFESIRRAGVEFRLLAAWNAKSREDAEAMQDKIAAAGVVFDSRPGNSERTDPDYPFTQSFTLEKPTAASPKAPAASAAPQGESPTPTASAASGAETGSDAGEAPNDSPRSGAAEAPNAPSGTGASAAPDASTATPAAPAG